MLHLIVNEFDDRRSYANHDERSLADMKLFAKSHQAKGAESALRSTHRAVVGKRGNLAAVASTCVDSKLRHRRASQQVPIRFVKRTAAVEPQSAACCLLLVH